MTANACNASAVLELSKERAVVEATTLLVPDRASPARWVACLSGAEQDQAAAFHFPQDRQSYVAAHALLRHLIAKNTGQRAKNLAFDAGPFGKPFLRDGGPAFSLSHTRGMVAVAVSSMAPVGIDVENATRATVSDLAIARQNFTPEETESLAAIFEPAARKRAFLRLWTRKEAYLKAIGQGLRQPMDQFSVLQDGIAQTSDLPPATVRSRALGGFHLSVAMLGAPGHRADVRWTGMSADAVLD